MELIGKALPGENRLHFNGFESINPRVQSKSKVKQFNNVELLADAPKKIRFIFKSLFVSKKFSNFSI
jgi:hypothetical protein